MSQSTVSNQMNISLANAIVFYQKLHHFHWRVSGVQFFGLHAKFEELYDRFAVVVDDIAERILTVGGEPVATLAEAIEKATLQEASGVPSAVDMAGQTLADLEAQKSQLAEVIASADKAGDRGTANLLDGIADELEKTIWMFRAFMK